MIDSINGFLDRVFNTHAIIVNYNGVPVINMDLGIVLTWSALIYVGITIICLFIWLIHILVERVD